MSVQVPGGPRFDRSGTVATRSAVDFRMALLPAAEPISPSGGSGLQGSPGIPGVQVPQGGAEPIGPVGTTGAAGATGATGTASMAAGPLASSAVADGKTGMGA